MLFDRTLLFGAVVALEPRGLRDGDEAIEFVVVVVDDSVDDFSASAAFSGLALPPPPPPCWWPLRTDLQWKAKKTKKQTRINQN